MAYVVYHKASTVLFKIFNAESSAKRSATCMNRNAGNDSYGYINDKDYEAIIVKKRTVKSLMTGQDVVIDSNTPRCCDPSSELYWSM